MQVAADAVEDLRVGAAGERDVAAADERERSEGLRLVLHLVLRDDLSLRRQVAVCARGSAEQNDGHEGKRAGRGREGASPRSRLRASRAYSSRMRRSDISIVVVAALVFADATIVTLALPNLLVDLHTTVYGVAAVLGVYTAALGGTALALWRIDARFVDARLTTVALCAFSLASVGCALAKSLEVLLVGRAVQGAAGAVILAAAGAAIASRSGRTWALGRRAEPRGRARRGRRLDAGVLVARDLRRAGAAAARRGGAPQDLVQSRACG